MGTITTWRKELTKAFKEKHDSWDAVIGTTLTEAELDRSFDYGYGGEEGCAFTVWTTNNVYFPWCYDGLEGVACVPRNPNGVATEHVGGG